MAENALKDIKIGFSNDVGGNFSDADITNILMYKALNKMEYFRIRCIEMEEKFGLNFHQFKHKIDNGEGDIFEEWDEMVLWEEYLNSFEEWKRKYEELNRFLK